MFVFLFLQLLFTILYHLSYQSQRMGWADDDTLEMLSDFFRAGIYIPYVIAITLNIKRWALVLQTVDKSCDDQLEASKIKKLACLVMTVSTISQLIILFCIVIDLDYGDAAQAFVQAFIFNPLLLAGYVVLNRKLKRSQHLPARSINIFFLYIVQHIILWAFGRLFFGFSARYPDQAGLGRITDIVITVLQLSNIVMFYGISKSIQEALRTEHSLQRSSDSLNSDSSIFKESVSEDYISALNRTES